MKTIYFIRHGQATSIAAAESDRDRPLTNKGISDVYKTGKALFEKAGTPDLIVSSTALRAISTAKLITEQVKYDVDHITENSDIYQMSVGSFVKLINEQSDDHDSIVFIGHNPTISYIVEYLTGEHGINMLPGSCCEVKMDVDAWKLVSEEIGSLSWNLDVF
jgi:phosphohistidine phosphatase